MAFSHLAGYTIDCPVNGRVHVVRFHTRLNGDMPATTYNEVGSVPVLFETDKPVNVYHCWIVEMQCRQPMAKIVFHRLG
jgi:hypothetical protein